MKTKKRNHKQKTRTPEEIQAAKDFKAHRLRLRYTQAEFAEHLGYSLASIVKKEAVKRGVTERDMKLIATLKPKKANA